MTKLSLRLKAIADLVNDNSKVIDVGCDHGLLDVYLAKYKKCSCLATDISELCLTKAKKNIKLNKLEDKIVTKVTDGLCGIDYENYDYVIISGMGFQTIKKILDDNNPSKLIVQSNNNIENLKHYLYKKYKLINEKIVFENNIYYVILYLENGKKKYRYKDYIVSLDKNNYEYINYLYDKYIKIYNKMPKKYLLKRMGLYHKILVLKKYKKH